MKEFLYIFSIIAISFVSCDRDIPKGEKGGSCLKGNVCKSGLNLQCEKGICRDNCKDYCKNDGICSVSDYNVISCECKKGYAGKQCESCSNGYYAQDEICIENQECNSKTCGLGVCSLSEGKISCDCKDTGFTGDRCEVDIDECINNTDNCDENAICSNTQGAFTCSCKEGYYGDGINCSRANSPFVTTWKTDNTGPGEDNEVVIRTSPDFEYDYSIDCDGTFEAENIKDNYTCVYEQAGTYTVSITGEFPYIYNSVLNYKILSVEQWGAINWKSMRYSFFNCKNLVINATDKPNLSNVKDMSGMFYLAVLVNQPLNSWDVSKVENMESMFSRAKNFNQPLDNWDTSSVTNMKQMFYEAENFNQPLNSWDVSKVTNMDGMFYNTKKFNQDLSSWNTSSVTNMRHMFRDSLFNGNIGSWDVSKVTNMELMFYDAKEFNQSLESWTTSSVETMNSMFSKAYKFNQPLNSWDVSKVTNMKCMFCSALRFNQPLNNWNTSSVTSMKYMFTKATRFNQNLSSWNTSSVTNMDLMFSKAYKFNQDLSSWNVDNVNSCENFANEATSWSEPKPNFTNCTPGY